jgi:ADP-ribose pyrophosphatase YjhB (NUDIX family)
MSERPSGYVRHAPKSRSQRLKLSERQQKNVEEQPKRETRNTHVSGSFETTLPRPAGYERQTPVSRAQRIVRQRNRLSAKKNHESSDVLTRELTEVRKIAEQAHANSVEILKFLLQFLQKTSDAEEMTLTKCVKLSHGYLR